MRLNACLLGITSAAIALGGPKLLAVQRMKDAGFEQTRAGILESGTSGSAGVWEVQRTGRDEIRKALVVECVNDKSIAHEGSNVLRLSLPKETVGFEFVTIGQSHKLEGGREYAASVWVRWPDGPEEAPAKADATSGHPSAIVSFWVRHRNATGDFAGRDVWLFDRKWKKLDLRFQATDPDQKSLIYVSLLPNQTPRATTLLVDDFNLHEVSAQTAEPQKFGELVKDGDFSKLDAGPITHGAWSFSNIGGSRIAGELVGEAEDRHVRISMEKNTDNYRSAQLWQMLELEKGVRYEIACRMRWDNHDEASTQPIVNYGMYHEESNTWYGPIDQYLRKSSAWESYRFVHVPPYGGKWKLYVQLNGWGNFGKPLTVSFDDFSCRAVK